MISRTRLTRVVAAVGATAAAGATAMLAVTTTASADEPGRCLENVNVREEPDAESRIVALCEAGTEVKLGEERDGFVRIDELGGWAAKDYVKADESSSSTDDGDDHDSSSDDNSSGGSSSDESGADRSGDSGSGESGSDQSGGNESGGEDAGSAGAGDEAQLDGLLS